MLKQITNPKISWLILMFFFATFAMANMESTLALFTEKKLGYGIREAGKLFGFIGIIIAFTQGYLIRKLFPKFGEKKILVIGPILTGIALAATGFISTTPQLMFTMALLAIGSGISNPAILGGISLLADPSEQGEVMGVNQSFSSLARILGPTCGGFLFSRLSPTAPYFLGGAVMLIACFIAVKNVSKVPNSKTMPTGVAAH